MANRRYMNGLACIKRLNHRLIHRNCE